MITFQTLNERHEAGKAIEAISLKYHIGITHTDECQALGNHYAVTAFTRRKGSEIVRSIRKTLRYSCRVFFVIIIFGRM